MSTLGWFLVLSLGAFQLCYGSATASPAASEAQADTPDALEFVVALRDTNTDPLFKCLTGRRVSFEPKAPSATYVWSLNAGEGQTRRNATFQFVPGDTPNTVRVVVNSDTVHPDVASVLYTDFKTCAVTEVNYRGHHCILWALDEAKDSVEEECLKKHAELCGEGVQLYDRGTCSNSRA